MRAMDLSAIPLFDHHCHGLQRPGAPLESLTERATSEAGRRTCLEEAFRWEIEQARSRGIVAFKRIAACRGGLPVLPRTRAEAAAAYPALKAEGRRDGRIRLCERPL